MKTVKDVSQMTGISVRTLHYYDQIGLLVPAQTTAAGYRLYSEEDLARLQQILFFKELDFPLKEISAMMQHPDTAKEQIMAEQEQLLIMKRDRLNDLISLLQSIRKKGVNTMDFKAFDHRAIDQYAEEAKARWQHTDAYKESVEKTKNFSKEDWQKAAEQMQSIFQGFSALRQGDPASDEAQAQVSALQAFISNTYYNCGKDILSGLGQMYVADERFQKNIDTAGEGTAKFASEAIAIYCKESIK